MPRSVLRLCWAVVASLRLGLAENDDGLDDVRRLMPDVTSEQLQGAFSSFQELGACGAERSAVANLESNRVFDGIWNVETGEVHESVRAVLRQDPSAYSFMVRRAFASGMDYLKTEVAYLDCTVRFVKKHGFRPHMRILDRERLRKRSSASLRMVMSALFLAIDFTDGKLLLSQHLNELTVERMQQTVPEYIHGDKQREALKLIGDYGELLPALNRRVEQLGRLIVDEFDSDEDL